jgi:hypothetical protein
MDHKEMVKRAEKWLLNTRRCGFVLTEFAPWICSEIPDAIGWDNRKARSYLIECKTSRADFLGDAEKPFRKRPGRGIGNYRYYMIPNGLVKPDELPPKWGLLYVFPKIVKLIADAQLYDDPKIAANKRPLLCSALRRVHLRGDLGKIYKEETLKKAEEDE